MWCESIVVYMCYLPAVALFLMAFAPGCSYCVFLFTWLKKYNIALLTTNKPNRKQLYYMCLSCYPLKLTTSSLGDTMISANSIVLSYLPGKWFWIPLSCPTFLTNGFGFHCPVLPSWQVVLDSTVLSYLPD